MKVQTNISTSTLYQITCCKRLLCMSMSIAIWLVRQPIYLKINFVYIFLYYLMWYLGCDVVVAKMIQEEDEREDDVITKVRTQRLVWSAMYLHPSYLASLLFQQEIVLDNYSFHFSLSGIIRNLRHLPAQSVIFGHHLPFSSLQTYEPSDNFFVAVLILSVVSTSLMPSFVSLSSLIFSHCSWIVLYSHFITFFFFSSRSPFCLSYLIYSYLIYSYLFLSYLFLTILILSIQHLPYFSSSANYLQSYFQFSPFRWLVFPPVGMKMQSAHYWMISRWHRPCSAQRMGGPYIRR